MEKAIKLLLLVVGVGLVIVSGYLSILSLIAGEESEGFILLLIVLPVAGLLIYAGLRKEKPKLKPQPAAQTNFMQTTDIDLQTRIGCIGAFVVFILAWVIGIAFAQGGKTEGTAALLFFIVTVGSIIFAIAWPIRGAIKKNQLRHQATDVLASPALSALRLSRVRGNTSPVQIVFWTNRREEADEIVTLTNRREEAQEMHFLTNDRKKAQKIVFVTNSRQEAQKIVMLTN